MSPKERFAWFWIVALVLVFGAYFTAVRINPHAELPIRTQIAMLGAALGALGILSIAVHIYGRATADPAGLDERDRLIQARSTRVAYHVLMAGTIVVGCVLPFEKSGWEIVHAALAVIAISEIVHHGLIVLAYRRGFNV